MAKRSEHAGLPEGPGGHLGAAAVVGLSLVAVASSWGTYLQFGPGLTFATLPVLSAAALLSLTLLLGGRLRAFVAADYGFLLLYALCVASRVWSLAPEPWANQLFWYTICGGTFLTARLFLTTPSRLRLVGYSAVAGLFIGSVLIVDQFDQYGRVLNRQSIDGVNPNFVAFIFAGTLYLVVVLSRAVMFPAWMRYLILPLALFVTVQIDHLDTRAAQLSVIGLVAWVLTFRFVPKQSVRAGVAAAVLLVCALSLGLLDGLLQWVESLFSRDTGDLAGRLPLWATARSFIIQHPIVGIGIGAFHRLNDANYGAHNLPLTLMLEGGIMGLGLFSIIILSVFRPALRPGASTNQRFVLGAFFIYWLPIAASGHWELAPFSWLILGMTFNLLRQDSATRG